MIVRTRGIRARIVGSLLVLSVLITALAGLLAYYRVSALLKQSIRDRLEIAVTLKERELRRMMARQREAVRALSLLPDVRGRAGQLVSSQARDRDSARAALATLFSTVTVRELGWQEVLVLDAVGGRVVFSTEPAHEGDFRRSDQFFRRGRTETFFQNVYPSPVTLEPTLTISTPLTNDAGKTVAVLAVHLNLDPLDEIVSTGAGLGPSGETFLVDRFNDFVSSRRFGRSGYPRGVHTEGIDAAIRGQDGAGQYMNHEGVPVVGVHRWLPDLGLAMIAEVRQSEAFAPAREVGLQIAGVGLGAALLFMVGFYVLARRITYPILAIKDTAVAVANGNLDAEAPVLTSDEVGVLARAFNEMTARLRGMVAEQLALERQFLHSQKLESLGVLAGGVAHDFNNLLMAIRGNLELALESLPPGAEARQSIQQAEQAAQRASDLTRQMLAYSGKGRFVVRDIRLSDVVSDCAELLRTSIPRTIAFDLRCDAGDPPVKADPGQVEQVVMNLVTNAAEAIGSQPGTITLSTGTATFGAEELSASRLEPATPGRFAWVEAVDTGCGMDEATLARMFEPFFTTKLMGRGLGLAALLGVVRGHHGAIFVESRGGVGTRVRVLFPVAEGASRADEAGGEPPVERPATALPAEETVLVVDDEETVRNVSARMVQALGLRVVTANDGEEAVRLVRERGDDVACVLLDLTMPRMDGRTAFERLRALRPDLPIVLCSGYDEQATVQQWTTQGPAGFIQKPYSLAVLRDALSRVMGIGVGQSPPRA
jgi:signal transduction histidine kinase/CheY-like chemotaxis protein